VLKNRVKALEKRLEKMSKGKMNQIFFVDLEEDENYIVRLCGKVVCEGDRKAFEAYQEKYNGSGSVFIIDDIPRPKGMNSLWVDAE
jgi:hypothetical protein